MQPQGMWEVYCLKGDSDRNQAGLQVAVFFSRAERPRQHHKSEQRLLPGDGKFPWSSWELHL